MTRANDQNLQVFLPLSITLHCVASLYLSVCVFLSLQLTGFNFRMKRVSCVACDLVPLANSINQHYVFYIYYICLSFFVTSSCFHLKMLFSFNYGPWRGWEASSNAYVTWYPATGPVRETALPPSSLRRKHSSGQPCLSAPRRWCVTCLQAADHFGQYH